MRRKQRIIGQIFTKTSKKDSTNEHGRMKYVVFIDLWTKYLPEKSILYSITLSRLSRIQRHLSKLIKT